MDLLGLAGSVDEDRLEVADKVLLSKLFPPHRVLLQLVHLETHEVMVTSIDVLRVLLVGEDGFFGRCRGLGLVGAVLAH